MPILPVVIILAGALACVALGEEASPGVKALIANSTDIVAARVLQTQPRKRHDGARDNARLKVEAVLQGAMEEGTEFILYRHLLRYDDEKDTDKIEANRLSEGEVVVLFLVSTDHVDGENRRTYLLADRWVGIVEDHPRLREVILGNLPSVEAHKQEAKDFVAEIVRSYIEGRGEPSFPVAEKLIALDNGETLSKEEFKEAWPRFREIAFTRNVTHEEYLQGADLKAFSPEETGILENERLAKVYTPQPGDVLVHGGQMKEGVENFIGYEKAFVFIVRKVNGRWTLVAIGG